MIITGRKGTEYSLFLVIVIIVLILVALANMYGKYKTYEERIGTTQFKLMNAYEDAEYVMNYIDMGVRNNFEQRVYDGGLTGFMYDLECDSQEPLYYGYKKVNSDLKSCMPKIKQQIFSEMKKKMGDYFSLFNPRNPIPLIRYEFGLEQKSSGFLLKGTPDSGLLLDISPELEGKCCKLSGVVGDNYVAIGEDEECSVLNPILSTESSAVYVETDKENCASDTDIILWKEGERRGSGTETGEEEETGICHEGNLDIILFGDSITVQHESYFGNPLQEEFSAGFDEEVTVDILGFGAKRVDNKEPNDAFKDLILPSKPDFVLLWFGVNSIEGSPSMHFDGYVLDGETRLGYKDMMKQMIAEGITPIILTPVPICTRPYEDTRGSSYDTDESCGITALDFEHLELLSEMQRELLKQPEFKDKAFMIDVRKELQDSIINNKAGCCDDYFQGDGIHPNLAAHEFVSELIVAQFNKWKESNTGPFSCTRKTSVPGEGKCTYCRENKDLFFEYYHDEFVSTGCADKACCIGSCPPETMLLDVPYYAQCNFGATACSAACGPVSMKMAIEYLSEGDSAYSNLNVNEIWSSTSGIGSYTSPPQISSYVNELGGGYFAYYAHDMDETSIVSKLDNDEMIITLVYMPEYNSETGRGSSSAWHFVLVTGISDDEVIINDPYPSTSIDPNIGAYNNIVIKKSTWFNKIYQTSNSLCTNCGGSQVIIKRG